jgi:hypothetical protein
MGIFKMLTCNILDLTERGGVLKSPCVSRSFDKVGREQFPETAAIWKRLGWNVAAKNARHPV